jgi:hypothetical protein
MTLVTLFLKLNVSLGEDISTRVFALMGVSVSTSIAGVLFRNMSRDSNKTLTSIQEFLTARQNNLQTFNDKEDP